MLYPAELRGPTVSSSNIGLIFQTAPPRVRWSLGQRLKFRVMKPRLNAEGSGLGAGASLIGGKRICVNLVRPEGRVHFVGESRTRAMVGWPASCQAV